MAKKNAIVNIENNVVNYQQAHTGARSIKVAASTLNQARKSLGGIANETITIGRDNKRKKVYTTIGSFMKSVGCPYVNGQVTLKSIKDAWADYLKDSDGRMMLCRNVVQRTKIGKQNYVLYHKDENGNFKSVSIYKPTPVRDNGWDPYRICEGLAQSKFIAETTTEVVNSQAMFDAMRMKHELYVLDNLTGNYMHVEIKGDKEEKPNKPETNTTENKAKTIPINDKVQKEKTA